MASDDYSYVHHWQEGDLVIADNHLVAHQATAASTASLRLLHRVSVTGSVDYGLLQLDFEPGDLDRYARTVAHGGYVVTG